MRIRRSSARKAWLALISVCAVLTAVPVEHVAAVALPGSNEIPSLPGHPAIEAGKSSMTVPDQPSYVGHEVQTPDVVSTGLTVTGDTASPVAGLPISLQVLPPKTVATVNANPADTTQPASTAPVDTTPVDTIAADPIGQAAPVPVDTTVPPVDVKPVEIKVQSLDAKTVSAIGGEILAFGVNPAASTDPVTVQVTVDYSAFRFAIGSDWANRLQLVQWSCAPDIAVIDPKSCGEPVVLSDVKNDLKAGTLTATATVGGLGVQGGGGRLRTFVTGNGSTLGLASSAGSFQATSLSNSGKWSVGGNSGSFSYSMPIATPPAFNGLGPTVSLNYDSSAVDGITSAVNSQAASVGLGWNLSAGQGFIERRYLPCNDTRIGGGTTDSCWYVQNATISLNGHAGELIPVDSSTGAAPNTFMKFRVKDDPDWLVERFNSLPGDWWTSEYWKVTTPEGMIYWFGRNDESQNSRLKRPLRGIHTGDPCNLRTDMMCNDMPYRWMLDKVEDPYGNVMKFQYWLEQNKARTVGDSTKPMQYDLGAYLTDIYYGKTPNASPAIGYRDRVRFSWVRRCVEALSSSNDANCPTVDNAHGTSYPDVPTDLVCPTTATTCSKDPSFFDLRRLSIITTYTSADGTNWGNGVNQWRAYALLPDPGDGGNEKLWLNYFARVVPDSTTAPPTIATLVLPGVQFGGVPLQNRRDGNPGAGVPYMNQYRLNSISDDLGQHIDVAYESPTCSLSSPNWSTNTTNCYPMFASFPGGGAGWGVYRRWTVAYVLDSDLVAGGSGTGGAPAVLTQYTNTGAAWHHAGDDWWIDTPGVDDVSWSDWRGFQTVTTTVGWGTGGAPQTVTKQTFYQGMNADKNGSGGLKSVSMLRGWTIPPEVSEGFTQPILDEDWLQGSVFESYQMDGTTGSYLSGSRNYDLYNKLEADGVKVIAALPLKQTRKWRTSLVHTIVRDGTAASPSPRYTRTDTAFDSLGRVSTVHSTGFQDATGDETCGKTWYINGSTVPSSASPGWMNLVAQTATYAATGTTPVQYPYDASGATCGTSEPIKVAKQFYSGRDYSSGAGTSQVASSATTQSLTAPFKPYVSTSMIRIKNWDGATDYLDRWTWTRTVADAAGRTKETWDAAGTRTAAFTFDTTYGYANMATYPGALGYTQVALRPQDGEQTTSTDQNGNTTNYCFDANGFMTGVYQPPLLSGNTPACGSGQDMSVKFTYDLGSYNPTWTARTPAIVTTSKLLTPHVGATAAVYQSAAAYIDGHGRTRETQTYSPTGGRIIVSASVPDDRGNIALATEAFTMADPTPGDRTSPSSNGQNGFASWPDLPPAGTYWRSVTTFDTANRATAQTRQKVTSGAATNLVTTNTEYQGTTTITKPQIGSWQSTTVDGLGRTTKTIAYNGSTMPTLGNIADGGAVTTYSYAYDAVPNAVNGHDTSGWLTTIVTDDTGLTANNTISVTDMAGRTDHIVDPNAGTSAFSYDVNGNVTSTIDASGNMIRTSYDIFNRPLSRYSAPELLSNKGFESGSSGWTTNPGSGLTSTLNANGLDSANAWSIATTGAGSVSQDTTIATGSGDTATATVWVRAASGTAQGQLCVSSTGGTLQSACSAYTATTSYRPVTVSLALTSTHTGLRFEVTPTAAGGTSYLDNASLTAYTLTGRLASWTYDSLPGGKGMAATETSWQNSQPYTTSILGYNPRYQTTSSKVSIPGNFPTDKLAGDWYYQTTFNEAGQPVSVSTPTTPISPFGGTPIYDTITTHYNGYGFADQLWNGTSTSGVDGQYYVTGTNFDDRARVTSRTLSRTTDSSVPAMQRLYGYDPDTDALYGIKAGWLQSGYLTTFQDEHYTRDAVGNITSIIDAGYEPGYTSSNTKECFLYDQWNRLIRAHSTTSSGTCATNTTDTMSLGTNAPYSETWTFDDLNRLTAHYTPTTPTTPPLPTYHYNITGHPHAVSTIDTGTATGNYTYNADGAMTTKPGGTLTYDPQQRLTAYTGTHSETYLYSTSNQRLIRQAGTTRTLYLLGGIEVEAVGTSATVTKYITIGGTNIATRTSTSATVKWNCGNMQNSATCQVDEASGSIPARKRYKPYGEERTTPALGTDHNFLGQPKDTTGLDYLNNRYYDPATGNFISVDPLVGKTGTPYLYAGGRPSTSSDPSGLSPEDACLTQGSNALKGGVWSGACSWANHYAAVGTADKAAYVKTQASRNAGKSTTSPSEPVADIQNRLNEDIATAAGDAAAPKRCNGGRTCPLKSSGRVGYPEDEGLLSIAELFNIGPWDAFLMLLCGHDQACQIAQMQNSRSDIAGTDLSAIDNEVVDNVLVWAGVQQVDACGVSGEGVTIYCAAVTRLPSMSSNSSALTLGHFILYDVTEHDYKTAGGSYSLPERDPELFAHESAHIPQWEYVGSDFLWLYLTKPGGFECIANFVSHTERGACK